MNLVKREITQHITLLDKLDSKFMQVMMSSKYDDISNSNFNIRKKHNNINMQIRLYNRYRKQYGKN